MKSQLCRSFFVAILSMLAAAAAAQETHFSISVGATYSDNVGRTGAGEEDEVMPEAGMQFSIQRTGRLTTDVAMDLQYRTYSDDAFDDELLGGVDGSLVYDFVPGRFSWSVQDNFGQSFIDRQAVETPDNRQNLNYFTTGPRITLPLGARTELTLSGTWSQIAYEESNFDNERLGGQLSLSRSLSDTSSLSVNASTQSVEFDEVPPNTDYDLHSAFLAWEASGARTTLSLQGGITRLRNFGDNTDGPLADLALTRKIGARSTLTLNAGTRLFDTADAFRHDRGLGGIGLGNEDVVASQDPFQQDYLTVNWSIEGARTSLQLGADWRSEDRETVTALDRKHVGAHAGVSRRIGPRLTASLNADYRDEAFDTNDVDFDEWSAGVGLDWSLSSAIGIALRAAHHEGSGDTSAGTGLRDFAENRYTLRLTYSAGN
ncbi:MAG: hypothetical protein ACT4UP_05140 [Gammaproteobacteria bacterium]